MKHLKVKSLKLAGILILVLVCMGLLLPGSGRTAEPYKIGGIFSVTGPQSFLGDPEKKSMEMFVEAINAQGGIDGHPLEAVIYDDEGDPTKANLAANKLISKDNVLAVIGPSTTPTTLAISPVLEQAKVPLISCAAGIKITDPVKPFVFKTAQSDVLAAYGNYLPTLSASGTWNHTRNSAVFLGGEQLTGGQTRVNDYYSTGLDLNYTIFNGFSREATMNRATSSAVSSENIAARTRQSIAFQVEAGYLNVLRNEQLVRVSEENLKRDRRQLERITEANRVGSLSLADVYRQQSQVAQDELSLITAQNNYDKSRADLVALIGLDVADEYSFIDPSLGTEISQDELEATTAQYKDFTATSQRALSLRPDYISASEQLDAAGSGVTIARAGYLPSVSAFAGYSLSDRKISNLSDNKNMNVGLSIRWSLFDGFQTNQLLQTAMATKRNAEISFVQAQRSINVEIKKALLDLEAARKQYEVSQKGLISATEDRKIAEERYNLGAGTLLDLLTGNAGLVNAEANKINAVYNYITAKRNMEYALGERKL